VADNLGEDLFERYVEANGYTAVAHHPDMGTSKRPDYLLSRGRDLAVVEVESFNTEPLSVDHPQNRLIDMTSKLKAVRRKISAGAEQLKGIDGYPLVVVLVNPINSFVPLEGAMFIGALFGDPKIAIAKSGAFQFYSGRNGRLHVTEFGGSVHGNHPYLSAVAVLRPVYTTEAWTEAMNKVKAAGYVELIPAMREMNRIVASMGEGAIKGFCLDVYETVSASIVPLPRDFLAGPEDTRWGIVGPGQYWQVAGPPQASQIHFQASN
jgi:hypothetical protein